MLFASHARPTIAFERPPSRFRAATKTGFPAFTRKPLLWSSPWTATGDLATTTWCLVAIATGEAVAAVLLIFDGPLATVSTTLTKLAKTGEISKAERGYRLPAPH